MLTERIYCPCGTFVRATQHADGDAMRADRDARSVEYCQTCKEKTHNRAMEIKERTHKPWMTCVLEAEQELLAELDKQANPPRFGETCKHGTQKEEPCEQCTEEAEALEDEFDEDSWPTILNEPSSAWFGG